VLLRHIRTFEHYVHFVKLVPEQTSYRSLAVTLLIEQYPLPIAGCHRLSFPEERFSIDLWLGDAQDIFPIMVKTKAVNAWFLDGFAPSCNPDMWEQNVLNNIVRLSDYGLFNWA